MTNCSKEEALQTAIEEFGKLEDPEVQAQVKEGLEQQSDAVKNSELEWEQSGDKEKYPHLYLMEKLNEIMWESMGVPKQLQCKRRLQIKEYRHSREIGGKGDWVPSDRFKNYSLRITYQSLMIGLFNILKSLNKDDYKSLMFA